jgi:hypothetical protein
VFPIVGGRKVEQLQGNIKALDIVLTPAQIRALEEVLPFDQGFPNSMIVSENSCPEVAVAHIFPLWQGDGTEDPWMVSVVGATDKWPVATPITPASRETAGTPKW